MIMDIKAFILRKKFWLNDFLNGGGYGPHLKKLNISIIILNKESVFVDDI